MMSFVATHSTFDAVTMAIQTLVGPEQQASLDRALWLEPRSLSDLRLRRLLRGAKPRKRSEWYSRRA